LNIVTMVLGQGFYSIPLMMRTEINTYTKRDI
jgi:hypothetical protein